MEESNHIIESPINDIDFSRKFDNTTKKSYIDGSLISGGISKG